MNAIFTRRDGKFVPGPHAQGVWAPGVLQGSATTALMARTIEQQASRDGFEVRRLTFELWRPVQAAPLALQSRALRTGRKISLIEASLLDGDTEVARCTALLARPGEDMPLPATGRNADDTPEGAPEKGTPPPEFVRNWSPYFSRVSARLTRGALEKPGPATTWMRLDSELVEGEPNSALVQAVQTADFAGGVSQIVDMRTHTFINPEMTIHFLRAPQGEWMRIAAETRLGTHGAGLAQAELSDRAGPFAQVTQALLFERRGT